MFGVHGNKIYSHLGDVFGECNIMLKHTAYQWIKKFKAERSITENELHSGRPNNMLNEDSTMCGHNLLQKEHQYIVSDTHHKMITCFLNEASSTTVYRIFTETLKSV